MNTTSFLRLISRTSKLINNNGKFTRSIQTVGTIRTSANLSMYQSKKERETFQDVLPCIMDTLLEKPYFAEVPDVAKWIRRVLEYNLAGGKKTRGLTTVLAYEMLEEPEKITEEALRIARVVGWCVEMLQAYLLVLDDVMDGSSTRRGVPCWYRIPDVGLGAINDSILIYTSIFDTLKTYLGDKPNYTNIVELFNETLLFTSIGQHLDYTIAHRSKNDYSLFTIDRYYAIVKYKTAYYSYKLPCFLALYMTNKTDKKAQEAAESVLLEIGKYFQVQDDYIDCFSDETVSGKAGTDIQEGKCSWLAVTALQRCNTEQRAVFEEFYGSKEPQHVQRIKQLYEELQLPQIYRELEQTTYDRIVQKAKSLPDTFGSNFPKLIERQLDMIYKRKQ